MCESWSTIIKIHYGDLYLDLLDLWLRVKGHEIQISFIEGSNLGHILLYLDIPGTHLAILIFLERILLSWYSWNISCRLDNLEHILPSWSSWNASCYLDLPGTHLVAVIFLECILQYWYLYFFKMETSVSCHSDPFLWPMVKGSGVK